MEVLEVAKSNVAEGRARAAAAEALLTPEQRAAVVAAKAAFGSRLARMFCGPELATKKGYMPSCVVSVEAFREFRAAHPATHRWAAWEKSLDI